MQQAMHIVNWESVDVLIEWQLWRQAHARIIAGDVSRA